MVTFICTIFASEALLPSSFGTDKFENSFCCRVAVSFVVPCFLEHWLYWTLTDCGDSLFCGSEYTLDNANIYWQTAWRYYKIDELTAGNVAKYHRREFISDYQNWRVPLLDFRKYVAYSFIVFCCIWSYLEHWVSDLSQVWMEFSFKSVSPFTIIFWNEFHHWFVSVLWWAENFNDLFWENRLKLDFWIWTLINSEALWNSISAKKTIQKWKLFLAA